MTRWWSRIDPSDRQAILKVALVIGLPTVVIPWFGLLLGVGLGAMVAIFRYLAGV